MNIRKSILYILIKRLLPQAARLRLKKYLIMLLRLIRRDIDFFYDKDKSLEFSQKEWTGEFCELVMKFFNPGSIIDIGCGRGELLVPFEKKSLKVLGVDGSRANRDYTFLKKTNFQFFDLRNNFCPAQRYDLCLCLEVGEHIEEKYSCALIGSLVRSAPVIIFSAAPPGQYGVDHVNLKPPEWWIEKFAQFGFKLDTALLSAFKEELKNTGGVQEYYIDNVMIFKKDLPQ